MLAPAQSAYWNAETDLRNKTDLYNAQRREVLDAHPEYENDVESFIAAVRPTRDPMFAAQDALIDAERELIIWYGKFILGLAPETMRQQVHKNWRLQSRVVEWALDVPYGFDAALAMSACI